ncbi:glycosyltransferase family 2 protein [Parahaliea aestuarii]|uniref:glycosyltransferase family 2 protein n=1 Tax=Parahaliea aestuarii TaxID=1852021 RepID=UPI00164FF40C|nr:glycosyltransferase family 2 protein [Parahaliea aestuarii]
MQDIAVIVLNWNSPVDTIACLSSIAEEILRNSSRCRVRLYPVDNGSQDHSCEQIADWIERHGDLDVCFIQNSHNLGFAGGMNAGFRAAEIDAPADYYWLLNNDLTLCPGALSALLDATSTDPSVAVWGPTIVHLNSDTIQCAGGGRYSRLLGMERKYLRGLPLDKVNCYRHRPTRFDFIYGAAMFIRGDIIRAHQGLDESYFLYYEELELARRLGREDRLDWCCESVVSHQGSDATSRDKGQRARSSYFAAYSACQYTWRHHRAFLLPMILIRMAGLAVQALRETNPELALAPWKAVFAFLSGRTPAPPQA